MAPYVEMEWGTTAYELMWQLKELFDPEYVLNPGVILNAVSSLNSMTCMVVEIESSASQLCTVNVCLEEWSGSSGAGFVVADVRRAQKGVGFWQSSHVACLQSHLASLQGEHATAE